MIKADHYGRDEIEAEWRRGSWEKSRSWMESFLWIRKISRIYGKGSVGETDSEPGAKYFWKGEKCIDLHMD